jgi:hypothetical protein
MTAQVVSLDERRRKYPDSMPVHTLSGSTGTMTMMSGVSGVAFPSSGDITLGISPSSTGFPHHAEEPHAARLEQEIAVLKQQIAEMKGLISQHFGSHEAISVEIRDVPFDQAKEEIAAYFKEHQGEVVDAADLQEALGIDIGTAVQACEELEEEGRIKTA